MPIRTPAFSVRADISGEEELEGPPRLDRSDLISLILWVCKLVTADIQTRDFLHNRNKTTLKGAHQNYSVFNKRQYVTLQVCRPVLHKVLLI